MDAILTFVSAGITWFPWFSRSPRRQRTKGECCVDLLTASQCLTFPVLLLHCVITCLQCRVQLAHKELEAKEALMWVQLNGCIVVFSTCEVVFVQGRAIIRLPCHCIGRYLSSTSRWETNIRHIRVYFRTGSQGGKRSKGTHWKTGRKGKSEMVHKHTDIVRPRS